MNNTTYKTIRRVSIRRISSWFLPLIVALFAAPLLANGSLLVQSTTSTANSGLYDHLLPTFTETTGIEVRVVAVGTGQAIKNASNCDADVLLVHAKSAEEKFVEQGYGIERFNLMYNDFIIVGPDNDPAGIAGTEDVLKAMQTIGSGGYLFASRGDDSGTHKKEMSLWQEVGIAAQGDWYRSTGSGMGATLNTAVGLGAYVLTDRATWITFGNRSDFVVAVQGDSKLFNQYGVIGVNPEKCPNVKAKEAGMLVNWLLSDTGQASIAEYQLNGQQLFFPNSD